MKTNKCFWAGVAILVCASFSERFTLLFLIGMAVCACGLHKMSATKAEEN